MPTRQRERPKPSVDVATMKRRDAEHDSRSCPYCDGAGLAPIYDPDYDGRSRTIQITLQDGRITARVMVSPAYCVCLMGDWVRYNQEKTAPDVFRKMPELHDAIQGRIPWLPYDPSKTPPPREMADMTATQAVAFLRSRVEKLAGPQDTPQAKASRAIRSRESWLVRFLVHILAEGPVAWEKIAETAAYQGRRNLNEIRRAAELARVTIKKINGIETWSLE